MAAPRSWLHLTTAWRRGGRIAHTIDVIGRFRASRALSKINVIGVTGEFGERGEAARAVRISIDRETCIGAGMCAMTAPEVFTQDDDGFSELLPDHQEGTGEPMVREAARACPVGAITVVDD